MRRCLLRRQDERLLRTLRHQWKPLLAFSFNLRFLTVLTSSCTIMHKLPSAQNFSDVQGKPMAQKNMTIETLAEMINEGFKSTASKEDIQRVEVRLDRIEHLLLEEQKRKIENLETRMKKLEDAL